MTFAFSVLDDSPGEKTIAAGIQIAHPDRPGVEIEIDFVALQRSNHERPEVVPLFLEAKYGQTFTRLDVARMAFLLRSFPYGVFGFSTTRSASDIDPHVLRRLRGFSRLLQGRREATHSTMLLTERELRASFQVVEEHDHIIGSYREIAFKTMERHLSSEPPSYVARKTAREEAAKESREQNAARLAARARAMSGEPEAQPPPAG